MLATKTIAEQLAEIYETFSWKNPEVSYDYIVNYYQDMLDKGNVYVIEDSEILGYYERRFENDTCFLLNVYAVSKDIFKQLYRNFFNTMPLYINYVKGEKQKLGGKMVLEHISKARRN